MASGASNKDMMLDVLKLQTDIFENLLKSNLWTEMYLVENNSDVVLILANKKQEINILGASYFILR